MKQIFYYIFLIIIFVSSCKIKKIEIGKFENYRLVNVGENKANIEFSVPVSNPNNFGFTISKINLDILLNDKEIGKVNKLNKIRIPAKSNQLYPILLELKLDKTVSSIPSLMAGLMKNKIGVKTKGYIKVRKFLISKKFPIDQQEVLKLF